MVSATFHEPVLVDTVRQFARGTTRAIDATVGGGGHAAVFCDAGAEVLAIDRDPAALAAARERLGDECVTYVHGAFDDPDVLEAMVVFRPDAVLLDLGVSSHQLDADGRGFTFRPGAPLDMRMDREQVVTAASLLNRAPPEEMARWFREYADERKAWRLANGIAHRRLRGAFVTSDDLVNAIRGALGPRSGPSDFARLFQAVRVAVNDELTRLERVLPGLLEALLPVGWLGIISYHSGEDRLVKHTFAAWARECVCPPGQPVCTCRGCALGRTWRPKMIRADAQEIETNSRARSATFRAFVKADA